MADPTEDDLRVADSVLMNTMLPTQLHGLVRSRIASALTAEREKAARILDARRAVFGAKSLIGDSYTRGLIDALEGGAKAIRAGDKE